MTLMQCKDSNINATKGEKRLIPLKNDVQTWVTVRNSPLTMPKAMEMKASQRHTAGMTAALLAVQAVYMKAVLLHVGSWGQAWALSALFALIFGGA